MNVMKLSGCVVPKMNADNNAAVTTCKGAEEMRRGGGKKIKRKICNLSVA